MCSNSNNNNNSDDGDDGILKLSLVITDVKFPIYCYVCHLLAHYCMSVFRGVYAALLFFLPRYL